jgi:hypothetical protein
MKHISVKLTDADYSRLAEERGDKNISDHIRTIIFSRRKEAENELGAFQTLIHDVNFIKESLNNSLKGMATKKDLLALSEFMAEVSSMANPPAYSHHKAEMQQLYQTLVSKMQSEG